MSIVLIQAALEAHLAAMMPLLDTESENVPYTPKSGTPYQRVDLLSAEPENPTMGDGFHREIGIFQIMLRYPVGIGAGDAKERAELIRAAFKRGQSLANGGITVQIDRTPAVSAGIIQGDRYCVPVRVRYFANVQT